MTPEGYWFGGPVPGRRISRLSSPSSFFPSRTPPYFLIGDWIAHIVVDCPSVVNVVRAMTTDTYRLDSRYLICSMRSPSD